jgi:hypothetical protein
MMIFVSILALSYRPSPLTRFLTLSYANESYKEHGAKELIPIRLPFRDFHEQIQSKIEPSLPKVIVGQVKEMPRCQELQALEPWFKEQLMQGKCLVMLDGLDEVPDSTREQVSRWANWQMQNYPSQFILTARPHGYNGDLFEGVQPIDILNFTNDQKRAFIDQWYRFRTWETWKVHLAQSQELPEPQQLSREQVEAQSESEATKLADDLSRQLFAEAHLVELAKNPLLLTIIAVVHEAYRSLPTRRVWLYERIFNLMLEDRPKFRDTRLTLPRAEENQKILQAIAVQLVNNKTTQFTRDQGITWIQKRLEGYCPNETLTPRQFLREIEQISGLLAGDGSHLYEFTHKTFQEYLTAVEMAQHPKGKQFALQKLADSDWKEVIAFYAALTDATPFIERALEPPKHPDLLALAQRLADENPRVPETLKTRLLQVRQSLAPELADVSLAQKFQSLTLLDATTAISECITWGEYQLFLSDQAEKQFHSWAEERRIPLDQYAHPVTGISQEDARWFCAWLSTQSQLAPEDGVYDYRLPTLEEWEEFVRRSPLNPLGRGGAGGNQPWTTDPSQPGNTLRVVRQRISDRYSTLITYLANGRWKEADQETDQLMLAIAGEDAVKRKYLKLEEIRQFDCDALRMIDQLWVKFSGGKFGFSVQKQIWIEVGGKLDFGEDVRAAEQAYDKMSDRNGWRVNNQYVSYSSIIFDTVRAPVGHLPLGWRRAPRPRPGAPPPPPPVHLFRRIFSRIAHCKL